MYESWKAQRETDIRTALVSRQKWLCAVEVTAPIIVLPEDCYDRAASELAIDLGMLRFDLDNMRAGEPWPVEIQEANEGFGPGVERLENHSKMEISSVKVLLSDAHGPGPPGAFKRP
jgi:hypothetical protein